MDKKILIKCYKNQAICADKIDLEQHQSMHECHSLEIAFRHVSASVKRVRPDYYYCTHGDIQPKHRSNRIRHSSQQKIKLMNYKIMESHAFNPLSTHHLSSVSQPSSRLFYILQYPLLTTLVVVRS